MALKGPNMLNCGVFGRGDFLPKLCWYSLKRNDKKWGGFACLYNGRCVYAGRGTLVSDDEASSSVELRSAGGSFDGKSRKEMAPLPKPLSVTDLTASPKHIVQVRVAYQGVPGAYSEAAAFKAYPLCEAVPCEQFEAAFKAVELWLVDRSVLPIENSLGGSIHRNYDLLLRHRLYIVGEALDQCEFTLSKLGVVRESTDDTAGAAQIIAARGLRDTGAITSARAGEIYGLDILAEKIQDDLDNITRFLVLAREPIIPGTDRPFKTSIVFTLEEGPGMLFKALAVFALRGINLTKIESSPQRKRPLRVVDDCNNGCAKYFDYPFYIDFKASMAEPHAQNALCHLQEFAAFLRVLGSYPMDMHV